MNRTLDCSLAQDFCISVILIALVTCLVGGWRRLQEKLVASSFVDDKKCADLRRWPIFGHIPSLGKFPHRTLFEISKKYVDRQIHLKFGSWNAVIINGSKEVRKLFGSRQGQFVASRPPFLAYKFYSGGCSLSFQPQNRVWEVQRRVAGKVIGQLTNNGFVEKIILREVNTLIEKLSNQGSSTFYDPANFMSTTVSSILYSTCYGFNERLHSNPVYSQLLLSPSPGTDYFAIGRNIDYLPLWFRWVLHHSHNKHVTRMERITDENHRMINRFFNDLSNRDRRENEDIESWRFSETTRNSEDLSADEMPCTENIYDEENCAIKFDDRNPNRILASKNVDLKIAGDNFASIKATGYNNVSCKTLLHDEFLKRMQRNTNNLEDNAFYNDGSSSLYNPSVNGKCIWANVRANLKNETDGAIATNPNFSSDKNEQISIEHFMNLPGEIMSAGSETSTATLLWLLALVASHPNVQSQIHREIDAFYDVLEASKITKDVDEGFREQSLNHRSKTDSKNGERKERQIRYSDKINLPYTEACLLECMRFAVVVPFGLPHYTTQPVNLADNDVINKNCLLYANLWSTGHDPEVWCEPQRFEPSRFLIETKQNVNYGRNDTCLGKENLNTSEKQIKDTGNCFKSIPLTPNFRVDKSKVNLYFPFGVGKRRCVGEPIGKRITFIIFANILKNFTVEKEIVIETNEAVNINPLKNKTQITNNFREKETRLIKFEIKGLNRITNIEKDGENEKNISKTTNIFRENENQDELFIKESFGDVMRPTAYRIKFQKRLISPA